MQSSLVSNLVHIYFIELFVWILFEYKLMIIFQYIFIFFEFYFILNWKKILINSREAMDGISPYFYPVLYYFIAFIWMMWNFYGNISLFSYFIMLSLDTQHDLFLPFLVFHKDFICIKKINEPTHVKFQVKVCLNL